VDGPPASAAVSKRLWALAESRLPARAIEAYTQGMMDLGAQLCTARNPDCRRCPVAGDCVARIEDRVAQLPGRRSRAPARRERTAMLVVVSRGEVLLEKRPPTGIWGGLWSLPEADADADPAGALERDWGFKASTKQQLPAFEHAFTHYTLEVTPWLLAPEAGAHVAAQRPAIWLPLAELAGAALPSPVRKLLRSAFAAAGTGAAPKGASPRR
jgi:A/G-specific adenine glycosylase